jgi:hypothetical protein
VYLRAYRLRLSDRDIDPRPIVPCDAESNLVAIGNSDLPATERSVVNSVRDVATATAWGAWAELLRKR